MAKNKLDMSKVVQRWNKAKNQLPKLLTNVSKNMFVDSWKRQGWDGEKWKEVQRRTPGTRAYKNATKSARTRAILVQSGTLRRSIVINSQTFSRMTISANVPYAEVHNEGFRGTINVRPSVRNGKKVRAYSYKANIPQRKFMGHGKEVEKAQRDIIGVALANVFMPGKFKYKKA